MKEDIKMSADKPQVYIVDDDESVCRALSLLLDTFGFEVRTFASAELGNHIPRRLLLK